MITNNGRLTTWTDTLENLLQAAHDAAFGKQKNETVELISDAHDISVTVENGSAYTQFEEFANIALKQGYWAKFDGDGGWEIMLNWSKDPANPPGNRAIHAPTEEVA